MVFNLSNEVLHFFVALFAFCRHACLTRRDRTFKYSQTDSYEALAFKVSPSNEGKWFSRSQKKKKMETALKVSKLRYSTLIFFALHAHCFFCLWSLHFGIYLQASLSTMTLPSIIFCSPTFLEVCTLRETGPWLYPQKSCRGTIHRVAILNKSTSFKQTTRSNTRYF